MRTTYIHKYRSRELSLLLQRPLREIIYCFTCFNWFIEEDWDRHCQMHLDSITSKYCATIIYCYTLFRPGFCPFCLGNDSLSVLARWTSWVRDAQLQTHLQRHLENARWPLPCPHPLCVFSVNDEPSFLYYLQNVHSLRMTR